MSNQVSNEISIQAVSDLDTLKIGYGCQTCNKVVNIFSHNLRRVPILQCKHCKQVAKAAARTPEEKIKTVEKRKQTSLERFGCTSFTKTKAYRDKTKATNLQKFGVENFFQDRNRLKNIWLSTWGVDNPSKVPGNRTKAAKTYVYNKDIGFDSSWELAIWIYAEDHNEAIEREPCSFTYVFNGIEHTYFPDFRYNGKLIEIKGSQFFDESGKMVNPFNNSGNDLMEAKHLCGLKNGVEFW